ncbi:MAG: beta-ketoacyl synthase chain length factor, partial [Dysgonamonadaceae bacterium]|nr:beta-ketoacyl synthase chain length factor [Dysgonamonadaceae bacterium]
TGLACINDLETFLKSVLNENEHALSPIPFINSSHNTVAAQISRVLKNRSYNNTFCHRGIAFENALQDAMLMLRGGEASNVLLGGIDEISEHYRFLLSSVGLTPADGEGAIFFMLANQPDRNTYAKICALKTAVFSFPNPCQIEDFVNDFLDEAQISVNEIDTLLLGINGNEADDSIYFQVQKLFPPDIQFAKYKHLCGEYATGAAFALALSAQSIKNGRFPESCLLGKTGVRQAEKILIFNHYQRQNFSLMIVEKPCFS